MGTVVESHELVLNIKPLGVAIFLSPAVPAAGAFLCRHACLASSRALVTHTFTAKNEFARCRRRWVRCLIEDEFRSKSNVKAQVSDGVTVTVTKVVSGPRPLQDHRGELKVRALQTEMKTAS
ncbi:hypothetical protein EVAR_83335_1 [Eumeta japonica]|uniref:Uncharacterized protein n=1 Tax=Eumeta variegata TaxID=151549 RepID=A0A4C1VUG1_EUMVA|nr:hypothetical protein EVAR_83335_1 [Eumeta japonica]